MSMLLPPKFSSCSLIRDVEITRVNLVLQVNWVATIDGAAHSVASSKDLLDGTLELLRTALEAHLASNVNDGGLWQIAGVLDVLRLINKKIRTSRCSCLFWRRSKAPNLQCICLIPAILLLKKLCAGLEVLGWIDFVGFDCPVDFFIHWLRFHEQTIV